MHDLKRDFTQEFDFSALDGSSAEKAGMNQWAVPWADLMMVMFVLFVVLFIYSTTQKNVHELFSAESAQKAKVQSSFDPLIGLIGQISGLSSSMSGSDIVRMPASEIIYKSVDDGVSVIRESDGRIKINMRGDLFFKANSDKLIEGSDAYLKEVAEVISMSTGSVHVIGYSDTDEAGGVDGFRLSSARAADVASHLITRYSIEPDRFIISGRGDSRPDVPDLNEKSKTMNRRVEIIVLTDTI